MGQNQEAQVHVPVPVSGSETSASSPMSAPDTVTDNAMHLAMQRLEAVQDEVHQPM